MCFKVHYAHTDFKIAKKNIICYKIGYGDQDYFVSLGRHYIYKRNVPTPKVALKKYKSPLYEAIDEGYHSFSDLSYVVDILIQNKITEFASLRIGKFIIPKGAKFYYNPEEKEYVSNTIIFQRK